MKKITVIGSMSIDLVVSASKRPGKGETILGTISLQHLVGKVLTKQSQLQD